MEKPVFFNNEKGEQLFGVLHADSDHSPHAAIVLCHAFGEEKLWSQRVFVNLAREASRRGIAVFRFDFRGHGDSSGDSEDNTLADFMADISTATGFLKSELPGLQKTGLLGLRFGASLAWLYAREHRSTDPLVLWEPVLNGERYIQELLRINLSTQLAIYGKVKTNREALVAEMEAGTSANVDGYLVSHKFYTDCKSVDLSAPAEPVDHAQSLVVQIAPNIKQKDRAELTEFVAAGDGRHFLKVEEPPFWREIKPFTSRTRNLVSQTLDWWEDQIDQ